MTTYNQQSHVNIGDLYTASMHNTLLDNLHAFWTNAAAGAMPYWNSSSVVNALAKPAVQSLLSHNGTTPSWFARNTGLGLLTTDNASALAWLAAGAASQFLRVNGAGTAFEFAEVTMPTKMTVAAHSNATSHNYDAAVWRDMPNSSLNVTVSVTSTLVVFGKVNMLGTGTYGFFDCKLNIDGTDMDNLITTHTYSINNIDTLPIIGVKGGVTAGTKVVKIREYCSAAGYTVDNKGFIVLVIPE
jgi:hypothetical protein